MSEKKYFTIEVTAIFVGDYLSDYSLEDVRYNLNDGCHCCSNEFEALGKAKCCGCMTTDFKILREATKDDFDIYPVLDQPAEEE